MKTERVTREDLRAIREGETRTYELPTYAAVQSAKSSAYACGRIDNCRFVCSTDPVLPVLTITRMPR